MTAPHPDTRLDLRTLLAGLGALLLLVSLFFDWYGDPDDDGAISAWTSFELLDVVLAGLALAVLYEVLTSVSATARPAAAASLSRCAGPVALVLVLVAIIDDPPVVFFTESELEVGVWLALAGALLMTAGAFLGRVRISLVGDEAETRPIAQQPPPPPPP